MTTNGTEIATETRPPLDKMPARKRTFDYRPAEGEYLPTSGALDMEPLESTDDFVLAPLVDKIAYGIARGLVTAVKELEQHIASETRKVADAVDRRLDTLQGSIQDLARFVAEQRSTNTSVQEQFEQLTAAGAVLREADARQVAELEAVRNQSLEFSASLSQKIDASAAALKEADAQQTSELESLRAETRASATEASQRFDAAVTALQSSDAQQAAGLAALEKETRTSSQSLADRIESICNELGVNQEDITATKTSLGTLYPRVDALVERLERQADAVRSMYTAYSQRETELEQLVDGLARLRAFPTPLPANGL